ncbi:hypothetical protein C8Q77DRAFT_784872 [Trametes polyzona]|nr:hypothetical protein C8Q77DRAFT_784872 [Trametes polyzona]
MLGRLWLQIALPALGADGWVVWFLSRALLAMDGNRCRHGDPTETCMTGGGDVEARSSSVQAGNAGPTGTERALRGRRAQAIGWGTGVTGGWRSRTLA